jgi:hypothetical protein
MNKDIKNFFNGFEISVKFCVFYTYCILNIYEKVFFRLLALFLNFECKCVRNGSKNRKPFFIYMS